MSVWTVKPEDVKLDLVYRSPDGASHPFWIKVKKILTVGEERRVMTAGWRGMSRAAESGETEIQIDWKKQTFARTEAYLTGWSLTDDDGSVLPIGRDVIESLNSEVYSVIESGLNAHVASMEEEKKRKTGSVEQLATSA